MSRTSLLGLIDSLKTTINDLEYKVIGTAWSEYYDHTSYSIEGFDTKMKIIHVYLERTKPTSLWDLGANTGVFSRVATSLGIHTISLDMDAEAVEKNYRLCKKDKNPLLMPLLMDLTNPSPALGWHHQERMSLLQRGQLMP